MSWYLYRNRDHDIVAEWVWQLKFSCVLDLADVRDSTLRDVAEMFGVTRERIRQIESIALRKTGHYTRRRFLDDFKDMV